MPGLKRRSGQALLVDQVRIRLVPPAEAGLGRRGNIRGLDGAVSSVTRSRASSAPLIVLAGLAGTPTAKSSGTRLQKGPWTSTISEIRDRLPCFYPRIAKDMTQEVIRNAFCSGP